MKNENYGEGNLFTREYRRQVNEESLVQMEDKALSNLMNAIGQINQTFMIIFRDVCLSLGTMLSVKDELKQHHLEKIYQASITEKPDKDLRERIEKQDKYAESLERQLQAAHLMLAEQSEAAKIKLQMSQNSNVIDVEQIRQPQQRQQQFEVSQQDSFQQPQNKEERIKMKPISNENIGKPSPALHIFPELKADTDVQMIQSNPISQKQVASNSNLTLNKQQDQPLVRLGLQNQNESRSLYISAADEVIFKQQMIEAEKRKQQQENDLASNQKYNSKLNYNSLISQTIRAGSTIQQQQQSQFQEKQQQSQTQQTERSIKIPNLPTSFQSININLGNQKKAEKNNGSGLEVEKGQNNIMEIEKDCITINDDQQMEEEDWGKYKMPIQTATLTRLASISSNFAYSNAGKEIIPQQQQNSGNKRFKKQNLKKAELQGGQDSNQIIQPQVQNNVDIQTKSPLSYLKSNREESQKSNGFLGEKKSLNLQQGRVFNENFEKNAYESSNSSQNQSDESDGENGIRKKNNRSSSKSIESKKKIKPSSESSEQQSDNNIFAQFEYKKTSGTNSLQGKKIINIRTKEARENMRSFQCGLCKKMHDALGENFCGNCSRHRSEFTPPHTPNAHYQTLSGSQSQDDLDQQFNRSP